MTIEADVVIAGGGVAGSAAAAALAAIGWSVVIIEPGQHDERRLSGELIHPAGVRGLADLGLLSAPAFASAARLDGFAVFPEADPGKWVELPYQRSGAEPGVALAVDHASICHGLLGTVATLPGVTIARGWRVTGLTGTPAAPVARIRLGEVTETIRCRLLVAADGASSPVRGYAGLRHQRTRTAVLTGYLVDCEALPLAGLAHVFAGAGGPVLAYAIGGGLARVLLNRPLMPNEPARTGENHAIAALPPRLRGEVEWAMSPSEGRSGTGRSFVSSDVTVSGVIQNSVVLVGDAAGTCHPISASGMTMGIDDAIRLVGALRRRDGDVSAALALYAAERRSRQRARVLLAGLLHDLLGGAAPEMGLLRAGIHRYWSGSARARAASMALLGMNDIGMRSIGIEFLRVVGCELFASGGEPRGLLRSAGLLARLPRPMLRHVAGALRVQ